MPKYLFKASYTTEGVRGLAQEGGSARKSAVEKLTNAIGGTLEAFYFAFGDDDVYVIVDVPDNTSAVTASLAVNSTGAITTKTVVLLTPEEIDEAAKKTAEFRPPGG